MRGLKFKMYVILVYDIRENKVVKVLKICRQYLHRIQNSVFQGELSEPQYRELKLKLKKVINEEEDSILIFKFRAENAFKKEILGIDEHPIDYFL